MRSFSATAAERVGKSVRPGICDVRQESRWVTYGDQRSRASSVKVKTKAWTLCLYNYDTVYGLRAMMS